MLSARPGWIALLLRRKIEIADRLVQFFREIQLDLAPDEQNVSFPQRCVTAAVGIGVSSGVAEGETSGVGDGWGVEDTSGAGVIVGSGIGVVSMAGEVESVAAGAADGEADSEGAGSDTAGAGLDSVIEDPPGDAEGCAAKYSSCNTTVS